MADRDKETEIKVAKGQDWVRYVRVFDGAQVQLSADAATGATTLTLAPDHPAIASGDKLLFGENVIVTTSGTCAAGATSLSVTALAGPLKAKAAGRRIVKDLSGYTLVVEISDDRDDATALITAPTTAVGDDATDPNSPKADVVSLTGLAADTSSQTPGTYYWALWNRASNANRPLADGPFILEAKAFV